jgi:hypothetical protein
LEVVTEIKIYFPAGNETPVVYLLYWLSYPGSGLFLLEMRYDVKI